MPNAEAPPLPGEIPFCQALESLARMRLEDLWRRAHDADADLPPSRIDLKELNGVISALKGILALERAKSAHPRHTENAPEDADALQDALEFDSQRLFRMARRMRSEESDDRQENP